MSFNIYLIWSSGGPRVKWSRTIYAILKEGIMGKIHVKYYEIWTRRRCRLKIYHIWSSGGPFVQWSGSICAILIKGIMRNNSAKLF